MKSKEREQKLNKQTNLKIENYLRPDPRHSHHPHHRHHHIQLVVVVDDEDDEDDGQVTSADVDAWASIAVAAS